MKKIGSHHDGHDADHPRRTSSSTSNPGENVEPALAPDNVASPLHKPQQEVPLQQHKQTAGSPERLLEMVRWSDGLVTENPVSERPDDGRRSQVSNSSLQVVDPLSETPLQALDGQGSDGGKEIIADDSFVQPSSSLKSPSLSPLPTSTVKKVGDLTTFSPLEEYESTRKLPVSNSKAPLQLRSSCVSTVEEEVTSPNRGARGVQETMLPGLEVTPILITLFFNTAPR